LVGRLQGNKGLKALFAIGIAVMLALTVLAVGTLPGQRSDMPILYWTSDPNPARGPQVEAFERWMVERGYPAVDFRLDSNNSGIMKVIIQSACGVGSEIVDVYGGAQLRQYVASGVLTDLTDLAAEYGFGLDRTYASVREEICVDGRQYAFPCNVSANPFTINRAVLEREGLPLPKFDWTWEEFLDWCLKVRKVSPEGRVERFAVLPFGAPRVWPTNGGAVFNETMTRCTLDSPEVLEATRFYYDLMFKHRVMPTPVDIASMAAQGGYAGGSLQWLGRGVVLGVVMGRYSLIQLRKFPDFKPDVALIPYRVMPMQHVISRAAAINRCASDVRLAARFCQFLADEPYNRIIIGDADALPPNPAMVRVPEFLDPPDHPGEAGAHEKYYIAAERYGVGREMSRFLLPTTVDRIVQRYLSGVDAQKITVEQALRGMTDEINLELARAVDRDPALRGAYERALAEQEEIDRLKRQGLPVPPERIANPVLRKLREAGR